MATNIELALMAGRAYQSTRNDINWFPTPQGWTITGHDEKSSGFEAVSFQNMANPNEIVISYAGTYDKDYLGDWVADYNLATGAGSAQLTQAAEYYLQVKTQVEATNPNATITFTGHSLGGGLAALVGVFFGKQAITFDQAPFANSANDNFPYVADILRTDLLSKGYTATDLLQLTNFINVQQTNGGIPNSGLITNIRVDGEELSTELPYTLCDTIGQAAPTVLDHGPTSISGWDLHSMALLSAFELNNDFRQVTFSLPSLLGLIFDKQLFAADTDPTNTTKENFLDRLVRHEEGLNPAVPNDEDCMLTRFTTDLQQIARVLGGDLPAADGGLTENSDLIKALTAFAMQYYYENSNATDPAKHFLASTATDSYIRFNRSDVAATLATAKGYNMYFTNYLATLPASERDIINAQLPNLLDWFIQAGNYSMTATAGTQRSFMLGGSGGDNLTGGSQADLLIGNGGADTLNGGSGNDIYFVRKHDTIIDSDHSGIVYYEGQNVASMNFEFKCEDGTDEYYMEETSGATISYDRTTATLNGLGDFVNLDNFASGDFGLTLTNTGPELPVFERTLTGTSGNDATGAYIFQNIGRYYFTGTISGGQQCILYPDCQEFSLTGAAPPDLRINGNDGNDQLYGLAGNDFIGGDNGNDQIFGDMMWFDGDPAHDALYNPWGTTTGGNDFLYGGAGKDFIGASFGDDMVYGGDDNDFLDGGDGGDIIYGDAGDDLLAGGSGNDFLFGGSGNDLLCGDKRLSMSPFTPADIASFNCQLLFSVQGMPYDYSLQNLNLVNDAGVGLDTLAGGSGNDMLICGNGSGRLFGEEDNDYLIGGGGDDYLDGGDGNDCLEGKSGQDTLSGGSGNDYLYGGAGSDIMDGGDGDDRLYGDTGYDIMNGGDGDDYIFVADGSCYHYYTSGILDGGAGDDTLVVGNGNVTILFGMGDGYDLIKSHLGEYDRFNTLQFKSGVLPGNVVVVGNGNDLELSIVGTTDKITLDRFFVNLGCACNVYNPVQQVNFTDGTIWDVATLKAKAYAGTDGNDNLTGTDGIDTINGGLGNDSITGLGGDDILIGGPGDDEFNGGNGNDILQGGLGNDTMWGQGGNDTYLFDRGDGQDIISDNDGMDTIRFGIGIDPNDIAFTRSECDLILEIDGLNDQIKLQGWGYGPLSIQRVEFANDPDWDAAYMQSRVAALPPLVGTDDINFMQAWPGVNDTLQGLGGDDSLAGNNGNDTLDGGAGNDIIYGYAGNDILVGGTGNDTLGGNGGNDIYLFNRGDGQDIIDDYDGPDNLDTIRFGAGIAASDITFIRNEYDLILGINGTSEQITILNWGYGPQYRYRLERVEFANDPAWDAAYLQTRVAALPPVVGTSDTNYLYAWVDNNDTLQGLGGDDFLTGYNGNDTLVGGTGNDIMSGGAGDDTYVVDNTGDVVNENPDQGIDTVQSSITYNLSWAPNVENLTLIEDSSAVNGTGNELDNIITGNSVANMLDGGSGNDELYGGDGADTLRAGGGSYDYLYGGAGNDTLIGGSATPGAGMEIDFLYGEEGDDTLTGGSKGAFMSGGAGNDTLTAGTSLFYNFMAGEDGEDTIVGGAGNDYLIGGTGNDTMRGGVGNDSYNVDSTLDVVIENTNEGIDAVVSRINYTLGANVENLILNGITADINGTGNELANTITGNAANNMLDGGVGADTMVGGKGNDTYVVDDIGDLVTESLNAGTDTVQSSVSYSLGANVENLILSGNTELTGTGNTLDNVITANNAGDYLYGGAGNDTLHGGAGYDEIHGGDGNDVLNAGGGAIEDDLYGGGGDDILNGQTTTCLWGEGGAGNDIINGGSGNDWLYGDDSAWTDPLSTATGNDLLYGNAGNDRLDGGLGADAMAGGSGNDIYTVDNVGDVVSENLNEGVDTVKSSITYSLGSNVEKLTLTGTNVINGTGNELANTLYGNGAANVLDGGLGADTMVGGLGNDTYMVDSYGDVVTETAGGGTDTVQSSTYVSSLGANVENLTLTAGGYLGMGNALDNVIIANNTGDYLWGGAGNDTLYGGAGNDWLDGSIGDDAMAGGAGNDTYMLGRGYGADTVVENDTTAGNCDVARFLAGVAADQLWFRQAANNLEVSIIGTTDKLVIQDWYMGAANHVEQFTTIDGGKTLLDSNVQNLVNAMAAFAPPVAGQTSLPPDYQTSLAPVIAANWA